MANNTERYRPELPRIVCFFRPSARGLWVLLVHRALANPLTNDLKKGIDMETNDEWESRQIQEQQDSWGWED